ncbi:MAG: YqhA family protein, partial [Chloroflexota bacterium]
MRSPVQEPDASPPAGSSARQPGQSSSRSSERDSQRRAPADGQPFDAQTRHPSRLAPLAEVIGRTRFFVLVAVVSVMLVSVSLFILGAAMAAQGTWHVAVAIVTGEFNSSSSISVDLLEVVSVLLKAVVFYLIGVGFYSLFVAPLNVAAALGITSFNDLEIKVVSVIIVIMGITFLER